MNKKCLTCFAVILIVLIAFSACGVPSGEGAMPQKTDSAASTHLATAEPTVQVSQEPQATQAPYTGILQPQDNYRTYYEIFVGSFYDSNGDGMGDINGVREKLDYINDCRAESDSSLHVGGIWLMPIMPSPSYHKYDVTDYYAIDPQYGTIEDYAALVNECHERGISVIIDLMLNHTSSSHPWFESAGKSIGIEPCGCEECNVETLCREHNKYCNFYNFTQEVNGGYHAVPGVSGWYYEGRFQSGMPDLNLDNEEVWDEIRNIAMFWIELGTDGFRLDATTSYYTGNTGKNTDVLNRLQTEFGAIKEDVYLVGEAWSDGGTIQAYYESGISSLFNFPMSQSTGDIISCVRSGKGAKLANKIVEWQKSIETSNVNAIDAPFLTNHDNARSGGALMRDAVLQKQAAAVYLLMPGNPFIYYGEEIGMTGGSDKDENKRTPLVWSLTNMEGMTNAPIGTTDIQEVGEGVCEQLANADSLLRSYIEILRYKNSNPAIARGRIEVYDTSSDAVCAYTVTYQGREYIVIHNLSDEDISEIKFEDYEADFMFGAGGILPDFDGENLNMPAHSSAVLCKCAN